MFPLSSLFAQHVTLFCQQKLPSTHSVAAYYGCWPGLGNVFKKAIIRFLAFCTEGAAELFPQRIVCHPNKVSALRNGLTEDHYEEGGPRSHPPPFRVQVAPADVFEGLTHKSGPVLLRDVRVSFLRLSAFERHVEGEVVETGMTAGRCWLLSPSEPVPFVPGLCAAEA